MAEIDNVSNWFLKQVISWFKGLDDSLQCYIPNLEEASITGAQLLALTYEDLNNLGVVSIGHQEVILEATELLKQLHFDLDNENLQSRALDLNCRCRALRSSISSRKRNGGGHVGDGAAEAFSMGPNIPLLRLACDVLDSSKLLVMWLDRPPFWNQPDVRRVRGNLVQLSYELSTTVQQSVFACVIDDAASSICREMEVSANHLIVSSDPMTIQPSSLEVAHLVNKDSNSGLGLFIKATFEGHHVITGSKEGSISSRIRRIGLGDEVVAISGQTVIGWQLSKLVAALKDGPSDISLTLKKRPHLHAPSSAATPTNRRQIQERVLTVPPPISPIRKVADSRKNSVEDSIDGTISSLSEQNEKTQMKQGVKRKYKMKKQKAKSSSNLLSGNTSSNKRSTNSQRDSVDSFGASSQNSSLHSMSSAEMLPAFTNSFTKNIGIRSSLERILKQERPHSTSLQATKTVHKDGKQHKNGKEKKYKLSLSNSMDNLLNFKKEDKKVRKALKDMNSKKSQNKKKFRSASQNDVISEEKITHDRKSDVHVVDLVEQEPPTSPLDLLVIPPPPASPYTPRNESVLNINIESALALNSTQQKTDASESPNSVMDIEHRRRFTVIGTEQMDDRWYNSLLSEVNAKREKRSKIMAKQMLEKLTETTASDDSVFFNTTVETIPEEENVVVRRSKPKLRNRPASMPANYYSPAKLQQFRSNKGKMNSGSDDITPVAHHVDSQGVKRLAPLNSITENESSPNNRQPDSGYSNSWSNKYSSNNNNNSANNSFRRSIEIPKKPPRSALMNKQTNSKNMPKGTNNERLSVPSKGERPRSVSEVQHQYSGLLQIRSPMKPTRRDRSKTDITAEHPSSDKHVIADELSKYFLRKIGGSASGTPLTPPPMSLSTLSMDDNAFVSPKKTLLPISTPARKTPDIISPPVAKPRTKLRSGGNKERTPMMPNSPVNFFPVKQNSADVFQENRHHSAASPEKPVTRMLDRAQASPTSRGSYVSAIDVGYALESINRQENQSKRKNSGSVSQDSDNVKVVDGIKVRLRKTGSRASDKKVALLSTGVDMRSRRISCRDLGHGECDGWLLKKKLNSNSPLSSKWSKRWVVLKEKAIYCYHTSEDDKAESYISLPGYQVTPAPECKKKFAFRVSHPKRKTFYFASDRQMDMSRWMNKMGLAAIEYGFSTSAHVNGESPKTVDYYSESDSEETFLSQSETSNHTASSTPNSSPEKVAKSQTVLKTRSEYEASRRRDVPGQPVLNRSARFPKEKAKMLQEARNSTSYTQTTESLQRNERNRSKSEATMQPKVIEPDQTESENLSRSTVSLEFNNTNSLNSSPSTSPRKKPTVSPDNRKHRTEDKRRKQFLEATHLSSSLEALNISNESGIKSSYSDEGLQQLRNVASKKAEEMAKRSSENVNVSDDSNSLAKTPSITMYDNEGKTSPKPRSQTAVTESRQRDIVGRPRFKTETSALETKQMKDSSIGDLSKALQYAEVDIHGVNRRATLRRKMTILSRDPRQNNLMLKKRALQRRLKDLQGELEYYSLLDETKITSESLHIWINQHPSLFAELGTIRKMSERRRMPAEEIFTEVKSNDLPTSDSNVLPTTPRRHSSLHESFGTPDHPPVSLEINFPKPRPRSCAMSNSDVERRRPRLKSSPSSTDSIQQLSTVSIVGYLETDL